jgi:hypothetical protein
MKQTEMEDLWSKAEKDIIMVQRKWHTVEFIDEHIWDAIDIGENNPMKAFLEAYYNIEIASTQGDLDVVELEGDYGTVLCFEVIEHVANPLHLLLQMRKLIEKSDGVIYISYPSMPQWLWNYNHYNEIQEKRFKWLLERANLSILQHVKKPLYGRWYSYFYGIRPFFRLFYCRRWNLYKLKAI